MKFVIEYKDTVIIEAANEDEAWEKFDASNTTYLTADVVHIYNN